MTRKDGRRIKKKERGLSGLRSFIPIREKRSLLGHLLVGRQVLPVHGETALHVLGSDTAGVLIVEREGRQLLEQKLLGLLVQLVGSIGVGGGVGLLEHGVELGVYVIALVTTIAVPELPNRKI